MEDTYKSYSGYHQPNRSYEEGACDFCHQNHVKVRPLLCMKHFFCRVCEDFAPKFKRRDYRCSKCSTKVRKENRFDLKMIDECMSRHLGRPEKPQFREIAVNFGGSDVVTFLDETDSEDDLAGNNTEWDQLFRDLASDSPATVPRITRDTGKQKSSKHLYHEPSCTSPSARLCPQISVPSLRQSHSEVNESSEGFLVERDISPTPDDLSVHSLQESELRCQEPELVSNSRSITVEDNEAPAYGTATPYPSYSEIESYRLQDIGTEAESERVYTEEFRKEDTERWKANDTVYEELERGSSPVKVCRLEDPVRRMSDLTSGSGSDSEIGEIEGPTWYGTSYSDDCLTEERKEEKDDFWD
ncbi:hypothetical protein FSP39_004733 [Pinctada imbricata]|uniref:Uncharacterized protein n=1 Tax=Pinctada imbricata TaxID=66713 RepID=A0AA89C2Y3_PINIB|nr:hypothetical protein FSP39_004733 [Pinctada imbricata]